MYSKELEKWKAPCEGARISLCSNAMDGLTHWCSHKHDFVDGASGAGFSLWGFVLARTKPHRLKPAPPVHRVCM